LAIIQLLFGDIAVSKQELYDEMVRLFGEFTSAHNSKFKKDAATARKAASALKKLVTPYNQASVAEGKNAK
jgi:hypothetical protein